MNRSEFMRILAQELSSLPPEERVSALKYYEEYFDEAGSENEQRVLDELGDPVQAARTIRYDYASRTPGYDPEPKNVKAQDKPSKKRLPVWAVVLIAIAAMIFGWPVVGVLLGIVCAVLVIAFAAVIVVAALALCCLAGFGGLLILGVRLIVGGVAGIILLPGTALLSLGLGLLSFGGCILLAFAFVWLAFRVLPAVFRWVIEQLRKPFRRLNGGAAA